MWRLGRTVWRIVCALGRLWYGSSGGSVYYTVRTWHNITKSLRLHLKRQRHGIRFLDFRLGTVGDRMGDGEYEVKRTHLYGSSIPQLFEISTCSLLHAPDHVRGCAHVALLDELPPPHPHPSPTPYAYPPSGLVQRTPSPRSRVTPRDPVR